MKCPYCSELMEKGLIESSEPINFMKEVRFVNRAKERHGEFNLAKPPLGGRAYVDVWLCRGCRKIVSAARRTILLSFNQEQSSNKLA